MEARIRQLQALLKRAQVVEGDRERDGTVDHGVVVTLRYDGDGEDDTQDFFVGSIEEHPGDMPVVSPSAPLGQALIGKTAGDTVEYRAPGGTLRVEIVKVGSDAALQARRPPRETLSEKVWDAHVVHARRGRAGPPLHRPPPRPRGHVPAGLRRDPAGRADRPAARPDRRHRRPQRPDHRHRQARRRPDLRQAARRAQCQLRRVRHRLLPDRPPEPGHRPRHRPRAGPDPTGHDDRLRRQPHLHPRRVRRPRLRYRDQRGRARPRHPDAPPAAAVDDGRHRRRRAARRRHRQGRRPRRHRPDRHRAAGWATSSSTAARPSARCRWKAG